MAKARIDIEVVQAGVAERRLAQIARAEQRLNVQFKGGMITSEQLRKSTERLNRAKALLTRRLNTNSASLRRGTRAAATMTTTLGSLRSMAAGVGVAFGLWQVTRIIGSALRIVGEFQKEMNRVRALTQATRREFDALERTAKKLGSTTQFTASQAAGGMAFLAQAGFKANEIVAAMPATLNLAAAAALDLATSADIVSNVMKGFRIDVGDLENAVDVLTTSFTSSNTNLVQLGEAMKKAGPVAKQLGFRFEEMVAVTSVLANAGIQAGEAGTALRRIMLNLIGDAEKFGITIRDASGKMLPFIEILRNIEAAGLSDARMFELVGDRAAAAISVLTSGIVEVKEMTNLLEILAVKAAEVRRVMEEGLIGSTRELTSAWEGFILAASDTGTLEAAQDQVSGLLRRVTQLLEVSREFEKEFPRGAKDFLPPSIAGRILDAPQDIQRRLLLQKQIERGISPPTFIDALKQIIEANKKVTEAAKKTKTAEAEAAEAARKRFIEEAGFFQELIKIHNQKLKFFTKAEEEFLQEAKRRQEEQLANKLAIGQREFEQLVEKLKKEKAVAETIGNQEHELAILRAQLAGDTVTAIVLQEEKRVEETLAGLEKIGAGSKDLAKALIVLEAQTAVKVAEENQRAFEQMAQQIDFFFQRAALGAKSFSDLFKQIWTQLLSFFISQVSRMVAAWVLGQRTMRAASAGGGGGGIGSILGRIFGGGSIFGSATAPGGTGTFTGAPIGSRLISGGAGVGVARFSGAQLSLPTPGAGSATGIADQETLLAKLGINLRGIGPISGGLLASAGILAALFGIRRGSPLIGALGGAAAGFAFGGPIGAIIGAIIGGVAAMFSRGKIRRRAAAAQEAMVQQMQSVVEEFKRFQIDSEAALSTIDQLNAGFAQQVQPLGKYGRRASTFVAGFAQSVKSRIREIQSAREARLLLSASSLIPEFHTGGLVDQRMLALLHPREAVLNPVGRQAVGDKNIERLNRGETPMGDVNIGPIHIHPSAGMDERALAKFTISEIRRAARKRGLPAPV